MQFIEKNYRILLFLAMLVAVVILLVDKKTGTAIGVMLGYIVGYVSNIAQIIKKVQTDHKIFETTKYDQPNNPKASI
jgi:hypothetical protein